VILAIAGAIFICPVRFGSGNRAFSQARPKGDLIVIVSYHLGQLGIAAAALLAFRV